MAITQIIATLPAVLNDSETFYEDIAIRNNSLVTVSFPSINTWATQANDLAVEVNDKASEASDSATSAATSVTTATTKANEASDSATSALGYKNDVGVMKLAVETIYDTFEARFSVIGTIDDFGTVPGGIDTVIVKDLNRGGTFIYDATESAVNNGGTVFDGWVRQYSGAINVKWFGAVGDGITDDTLAIQSAAKSLTNNSTLEFNGNYLISWKGTKALPYATIAIDLVHLENITIIGNNSNIIISNHDVGLYGGLLFLRIRACKNINIYGFNSKMTFIGANNDANYYPTSGFLYAYNLNENGTADVVDRLTNISVHDCTFDINSQYGSFTQSSNPYLGDVNNGGKYYSVFIRGDSDQAEYNKQNNGVYLYNLRWFPNHNTYGIWVWAFSNVLIKGNVFEGFTTATYGASLSIIGGGVPAIRCHKFFTRNWKIEGNIINSRVSPGTIGNLDGHCALIGFQEDNCIASLDEGLVEINDNILSVGSGSLLAYVDIGIELLCGGNFDITSNKFTAINAIGNPAGIEIGNYVTYNNNIYQSVNIIGNTFSAKFGTSGANGGATPIIYTSSSDTLSNRTLKSLVVKGNTFLGYNQQVLALNTGIEYPQFGTFTPTLYNGAIYQDISNNTINGDTNVVLSSSKYNVPLHIYVGDSEDIAIVSNNTISSCYRAIAVLGDNPNIASISCNSISNNFSNIKISGHGSFSSLLSGVVESSYGIFNYSKNGEVVTISLESQLVLTSNSTSKSFSNINFPSSLLPSSAIFGTVTISDNGQPNTIGLLSLDAGGNISIFKDLSAGDWTASGQCVIGSFSFTYII